MPKCNFCGGEIDGKAMHVNERWRLYPQNCELYELRALRDRLIELGSKLKTLEINFWDNEKDFDEMRDKLIDDRDALIKRATELKSA